jgi:hypothetical protein
MLVIELEGDGQLSRDLAAGGVFVPGCALRLAEECDLVVRGANHQLLLPARVVYVDAQRGAGLELIGFSLEVKARLAELEPLGQAPEVVDEPSIDDAAADAAIEDWVLGEQARLDDGSSTAGNPEPAPLIDLEALHDVADDDLAITVSDAGDADGDTADARGAVGLGDAGELDDLAAGTGTSSSELDTLAGNTDAFDTLEPDPGLGPDDAADRGARGARRTSPPRAARNVHERLRGLTLTAQLKLAASGEQHERILLERLYGKNVWETLLRNPRLSPPEVSRIARYGTLPRVLLDVIVGNSAWLQVPEVRRALLSNPRLATDQIIKVLRLMPKHEVKLAAVQTAYPYAVRNAAKMVLRSD